MITIQELAKKYGITRQTVYVWRKEGMPCTQFSRNIILFDEEKVDVWVQENKNRY